MQSESGTVRARGRKVQTENHFRAAELNRRMQSIAGNQRRAAPQYNAVSSDGCSSVIRNAYDSMLY